VPGAGGVPVGLGRRAGPRPPALPAPPTEPGTATWGREPGGPRRADPERNGAGCGSRRSVSGTNSSGGQAPAVLRRVRTLRVLARPGMEAGMAGDISKTHQLGTGGQLDWVPEGIDLTTPRVARADSYMLGGGHSFGGDREFG